MAQPKACRLVEASRTRVWEVLADGWTYSQWVVGNSRMRTVAEDWPASGAVIEHSIGVWPLVIDDCTISQECRPPEELVLLAGLGAFGAARISLRLEEAPGGCCVEMLEVPVRGLMSVIPNHVALVAVYPRNLECLRRLAALAERRSPDAIG